MQFCDLNRQYQTNKIEIDNAIQEVIDSSSFINGRPILEFEENLQEFVGVKNAIACSSGTDALLLALMVYNVQPGDEIICPAFSFIASASMISFYKAVPVFVDVSPLDYNIDVSEIEKKITPKTRGIIGVSLFGQCADFDRINELATKYNLWVIEDAAQSFGAKYKGRQSGSLTDIATTSFFPAKPLGCYGDGGAVFTNDDGLADRIRMLRSHGQEERYHHKFIGINGRMDTIQAAILNVKLKSFLSEVKTRRMAAKLYSELLSDYILKPEENEGNESVWAQYTIGVENRSELKDALSDKGIPTAIHYPIALPKQKAFSLLEDYHKTFGVAELLSETVLSLPIHGLITEEEVKFVSNSVNEFIND